MLTDSDDPFFVRFYSHFVVTMARNIVVNETVKEEVSAQLDLQVKTTEQVCYQALKQAVSDGKNLRRCFNSGLILLSQKLL